MESSESVILSGARNRPKQELARRMRRAPTPAENLLWQHLRRNGLDGLHFWRQQVISGFIVDFYCHEVRLAVEVDGGVHDGAGDYDAERTRILAGLGVTVIRVENDHVLTGIRSVMDEIRVAVRRVREQR